MKTLTAEDLPAAEAGAFYTICGAGGPLREWVEGYEKLLAENGIGKPTEWFQTTGAHVNLYATQVKRSAIVYEDNFKPDLVILMFPLDGLDIGRLALFKMQMQDRWFDDIIENMRKA